MGKYDSAHLLFHIYIYIYYIHNIGTGDFPYHIFPSINRAGHKIMKLQHQLSR